MTPKNKADDLKDKFLRVGGMMTETVAKQCAYICVNEMWNLFNEYIAEDFDQHNWKSWSCVLEYCENIKKEI